MSIELLLERIAISLEKIANPICEVNRMEEETQPIMEETSEPKKRGRPKKEQPSYHLIEESFLDDLETSEVETFTLDKVKEAVTELYEKAQDKSAFQADFIKVLKSFKATRLQELSEENYRTFLNALKRELELF